MGRRDQTTAANQNRVLETRPTRAPKSGTRLAGPVLIRAGSGPDQGRSTENNRPGRGERFSMGEPTIEDYFLEDRTFPPPPEFVAAGPRRRSLALRRGRRRLRGASGPGRPASSLDWFDDFDTDPRVGAALRQVVRRRHAQRLVQLPRPPRRGRPRRQGRATTGRASRATPARSPTPTCSTRCSRFANVLKGLGVREGRPGRASTCR